MGAEAQRDQPACNLAEREPGEQIPQPHSCLSQLPLQMVYLPLAKPTWKPEGKFRAG